MIGIAEVDDCLCLQETRTLVLRPPKPGHYDVRGTAKNSHSALTRLSVTMPLSMSFESPIQIVARTAGDISVSNVCKRNESICSDCHDGQPTLQMHELKLTVPSDLRKKTSECINKISNIICRTCGLRLSGTFCA